ncbi:RNA polymerase sigma factor [Paenibacillus xanthanilyticus]|uniref:RNA polymerase sigma factor n=1 Tax=Paenibacillus xanthanilyticus TaxID=1783531 RepID=A0ABV8JUP6_9BACL
MDRPTDDMRETLLAMCDGSACAFETFYERFAPLVMKIALRVTGDRMEAEDVCHDVFLEALRRGRAYDPARGSIAAWLAVMARSRSLDRMRRRQRLVQAEIEELERAGEAAPTEDVVLTRLQKEELMEALRALPDSQRTAVVGSYFGESTQREMSAQWNVPLGTVKSWVRYGLNHLRKQLEKRGGSSEPRASAKGARR